jgi:hypothetical protein
MDICAESRRGHAREIAAAQRKRFRSGLKALRAQFAKARRCARRNARRAGARQRATSPRVTKKMTKSLAGWAKKFFRRAGVRSANFDRCGISLVMIRKMQRLVTS